MILQHLLARVPANPDDPDSAPLYVFRGALSDTDEELVKDPAYGNLPYAYILNLPDAEVVRYDGGEARWNKPVDVVLEQREPYAELVMRAVWNTIYNTVPESVDELEPGVPLAGRLAYVGGMTPQVLRKGFLESTLRFESTWLPL